LTVESDDPQKDGENDNDNDDDDEFLPLPSKKTQITQNITQTEPSDPEIPSLEFLPLPQLNSKDFLQPTSPVQAKPNVTKTSFQNIPDTDLNILQKYKTENEQLRTELVNIKKTCSQLQQKYFHFPYNQQLCSSWIV
jgi:hypothetical protein